MARAFGFGRCWSNCSPGSDWPGSIGGKFGFRRFLPEPLIAQLAQPGGNRDRSAGRQSLTLHLVFIAHAFLIGFMVVASLIDVDERLIPDEVTVPGTLLGLLFAALLPWSLLPIMYRAPSWDLDSVRPS